MARTLGLRKSLLAGSLLVMLLPTALWAPIFGIFSGLPRLIQQADAIVVARGTWSLPEYDRYAGSIRKIRILHSLKGDLKANTTMKVHLRDLPLLGADHAGVAYSLYPSYSLILGNRFLVFMRKRWPMEQPDPRYEYTSLNCSGDMFWIAPLADISKLEGPVEQQIEQLLRENLKFNGIRIITDKHYEESVKFYLNSK